MTNCAPKCPACGRVLVLVWVHGHGQCVACRTNVEPCCSGAPLGDNHVQLSLDRSPPSDLEHSEKDK